LNLRHIEGTPGGEAVALSDGERDRIEREIRAAWIKSDAPPPTAKSARGWLQEANTWIVEDGWVALGVIAAASFFIFVSFASAAMWLVFVAPVLILATVFSVTRKARDRMRVVGWSLVGMGPAISVVSWLLALLETASRRRAWHEQALQSMSLSELRLHLDMLNRGLVPAWTTINPWPGIIVGLAIAGLGVVVLAIRRPTA
jgi:hypothetical protein